MPEQTGEPDEALFALEPQRPVVARPAADLAATGGLEVTVDPTFRTAEHLRLDETSWIEHVHGWLHGDDVLMRTLMTELSWEQRTRWMYTREVTEPRLTAEYAEVATAPLPVLGHLAEALGRHYRRRFTRLWLNWYRDHADGTGWHADRPADQQADAVIPVLSLGATRRFLVRPRSGGPSRTLVVRGGDLVVMRGRTQRDHEHSVPKERAPAGPRLSLNFSIDPPGSAARR